MLDPANPESFTWKTVEVSAGHQYRYIDQSPKLDGSSSVVLCLHGFPDLAMGWRYQIIDLVGRGHRVIAPDLLGYGGTAKPTDLEAYSKLKICNSLVELLEHEKITHKVTVVAHDWGSVLGARFVQYFPQKVKSWVTICVPPFPASPPGERAIETVTVLREREPFFGYQFYFMSPESNEDSARRCKTFLLLAYHTWGRGLESSVEKKLARFEPGSGVYRDVFQKQLKELGDEMELAEITDPELQYFLSEFEKGGLACPLNWYRVGKIDAEDEHAAGLPIEFPSEIPCLFICATNDPTLRPSLFSEKQKALLFPKGNLTCATIEGAPHFLMQNPDYRDELSKVLGEWIDKQV